MNSKNNVIHIPYGGYKNETSINGVTIRQLVESKGLDILHHRLGDSNRWAVGPIVGWDGLEFVYILKGSLSWKERDELKVASVGDYLIMDPILEDTLFKAIGETEFLYISSGSMYESVDDQVKEYMDLAVTVEEKDGYTADHCRRIKDLSMKIGEVMELSSEELLELNFGSFLHDIGKTKIPDAILNKPGKLTNEEYEEMKLHTVHGADLLRKTGIPILEKASIIVEQHHERYNGTGYPKGLKGDEISLLANIVAVIDSFDAMTSVRVYSQGRSVESAIEEIKRERGRLFHPQVVDAFLFIQ
ncbi:HD-GYP domain-containing protein [Litchfieldia salsa]|uniref:HD domain-containing protein n=1 Tax=Litchfieldia salsa TaxID=930152 RepID=A0A1H0PPQ9_9BACI|nr:HD-GYP domain-containing protein [Litchfieldia salsa]SDP07043.1 HD domain-containing protein [Litchfieldia salsa]